tara:strand:+ start:153 stop:878 length:726 start_codon:yes stop_codon:yes gene_type:complete
MNSLRIYRNKKDFYGEGHGFLTNFISKSDLKIAFNEINKLLLDFKPNQKYYDLSEFIDDFSPLILNSPYLYKLNNLLYSDNPTLEALELHIQYPGSVAIPPHQDNFYHNIDDNLGLKILIPFQKLSFNNGGLIFIDVKQGFPVLKHSPSSVESFSSYISSEIFDFDNSPQTTYSYEEGDISYHFLNTPHFSQGNQTALRSAFIVFRMHSPLAIKNTYFEKIYQDNYKEHLRLINESKNKID